MPEPAAASLPWLVRLYPPSWRRRYGDELAALLAEQALSPAAVFDLMGGALDAWVSPQPNLHLQDDQGAPKMNTRWITCAKGGPPLTVRESLLGAGVVVVGSLVLSVASLLLRKAYGNVAAVEALHQSLFPALLLLSTSGLFLQRRSWRAQAVFVLFFLSIVYLIMLGSVVLGGAH